MRSNAERAWRYRDRAEELRALTDPWHEPFAKEALERLAREYEALASKLDPDGTAGAAEGLSSPYFMN